MGNSQQWYHCRVSQRTRSVSKKLSWRKEKEGWSKRKKERPPERSLLLLIIYPLKPVLGFNWCCGLIRGTYRHTHTHLRKPLCSCALAKLATAKQQHWVPSRSNTVGQNSGSGLPTLHLANPVATILLQLPSVSCLVSHIQNKSQGEWKGQNVSTNVIQMNTQLTSAVICISWEKDAPHMHLHMFPWLGLKSFI